MHWIIKKTKEKADSLLKKKLKSHFEKTITSVEKDRFLSKKGHILVL